MVVGDSEKSCDLGRSLSSTSLKVSLPSWLTRPACVIKKQLSRTGKLSYFDLR